MEIRLAIIGLGQIGASLGLALQNYRDKITRIGFDRNPATQHQALEMNAIDQEAGTPADAVKDADVVFLSIPLDELNPILHKIAPALQEDCVLLETTPIKKPVSAWMNEILPPRRHYVGWIPVINPRYLEETSKGIDAAHGDLFAHGSIVITSEAKTAAEAIKLASDLARLAGSSPIFMNQAEADAAMASVHILPQLQAAALLNATVNLPEWQQARNLAGRSYAAATAPIMYQDDRLALRDAALLNDENVIRALDGLIAALRYLRQAIEEQNMDALQERIQRAHKGRRQWWESRERNDWLGEELEKAQIGSLGDYFGHLMGSRPRKKP